MIRVALYLVLVGLLALGVAWFADRPGEVAVTWQGLRIETSVTVMIVAFIVAVVLSILAWSIVRGVLRSPRQWSEFWRRRRSGQGHLAITKGLLAVGSGDAGLARKYADEANRLASGRRNANGTMRGAVISLRSLRRDSLAHHSTPLPQPGSRMVVMPWPIQSLYTYSDGTPCSCPPM